MKTIYTLLFMFLILSSGYAKKIQLTLKLEQGKEYRQVSDSKVNVNQEINGQKMNIVIQVKASMTYLVKAVNDHDYDLEVKYDSLSMIMQLPQATMMFSSEKNSEQDMVSQILEALKNQPFGLKLSDTGKVMEVKNIESLFESIFSKFPQTADSQVTPMKDQIKSLYGEDSFKGNIQMVTAIFPEGPVAIGDTWTVDTKVESGMSANVSTTYTLKDSQKDYVLIDGDSKFESANKDAYSETNGMPIRYDLAGTIKSGLKIDSRTGWIIEAKLNQDIQGNTYIKESDQMPNGMKIPMTMNSETVVTNQ